MKINFFYSGLVWFARIAIGGIFIFTGVSKLLDLRAFSDNIATFDLAPHVLIDLVALTVPVLEVIFGGMLLFGRQVQVASLGVVCLASIFSIAFLQAAFRGLNVDCGCFGAGATHSNVWLGLFRAIVILLVATWLYIGSCRQARTLTSVKNPK